MPAHSTRDLLGREVLSRYVLRQRLGRGTTGEVWRASDRLTDDAVAVKLLAGGEGERASLRREVAALRVLHIRGVARFIDEGVDRVGPVVVMELVDGSPFPGGFTSEEDIIAVTTRLLNVLGRLHALGLVHRDLKPANVLVTRDGQPVLLDFGLAVGALSLDGEESCTSGTPAYVAPEQVLQRSVDARTDLYALGAMLFEALAGSLPFPDCSTFERIALRTQQAAPPLASRAPDAPRSLATLVDSLLATSPDARPSSAAEALHVLEGGHSRVSGPKLPRLGDGAALSAVLAAVVEGRAIDVIGARGSGRTRLLDDAAEALKEQRREVLRASGGEAPFESLRTVLPSTEPESLGARGRRLQADVPARLAAGATLLVDDLDRADRWSQGLIHEWARSGAVVCVRDAAAQGHAAVFLGPLSVDDLRALFSGPERLLHIPSDAARALWNATSGIAARVADEVHAWIRSDLARWNEDRLVIDRASLDTVSSDVGAPLRAVNRGRPAQSPFAPRRPQLLDWICLAWPHTTTALLASALERPVADVTREVESLVARGDARMLVDGHVEPTAPGTSQAHPPWVARAHASLAAALPRGTDGRLFHLVAAARRSPEDPRWSTLIADEAAAVARRRVDEGRHGEAAAVLAKGLHAVRNLSGGEAAASEEQILGVWVEVALGDVGPRSADRVAYELCRVKAPSPHLKRMLALVEAALTARRDGERALSAAEAIAPFEEPSLEWWRHAVRMLAARRTSSEREATVLAEVTAWATTRGDREALRSVAAWRGRWMYRRGEYDAAGRSHFEAASEEPNATRRLGALTSAASSWLEALRLDDAERVAKAAFEEARRIRHPYFEARAEWILRAVRYRRGIEDRPDEDLLASVAWLCEGDVEGLITNVEAAFAWRCGALPRARELASQSRRLWQRAGIPSNALLMRCLAIASGDDATRVELEELLRAVAVCPHPRLAAQSAGRLAPLLVNEASRAAIEAARRTLDPSLWGVRLEVLSLREAADACTDSAQARTKRLPVHNRQGVLRRHRPIFSPSRRPPR